jgi:hypothetical protein
MSNAPPTTPAEFLELLSPEGRALLEQQIPEGESLADWVQTHLIQDGGLIWAVHDVTALLRRWKGAGDLSYDTMKMHCNYVAKRGEFTSEVRPVERGNSRASHYGLDYLAEAINLVARRLLELPDPPDSIRLYLLVKHGLTEDRLKDLIAQTPGAQEPSEVRAGTNTAAKVVSFKTLAALMPAAGYQVLRSLGFSSLSARLLSKALHPDHASRWASDNILRVGEAWSEQDVRSICATAVKALDSWPSAVQLQEVLVPKLRQPVRGQLGRTRRYDRGQMTAIVNAVVERFAPANS